MANLLCVKEPTPVLETMDKGKGEFGQALGGPERWNNSMQDAVPIAFSAGARRLHESAEEGPRGEQASGSVRYVETSSWC